MRFSNFSLKLLSLLFGVACLVAWVGVPSLRAQPAPAGAAVAKISPSVLLDIRSELKRLATAIDAAKADGDALMALRTRIEPMLADIKPQVKLAEARRVQAQQALSRLGPRPVSGQAPETADSQAERVASEEALALSGADLLQAKLVLAEAELQWNRATDLRRELFAHRIFSPSMSPLSPAFWSELVLRGIPLMEEKTVALWQDWAEHHNRPGGTFSLVMIGLAAVLLAGGVMAVPILARRFLAGFEPDDGGMPGRAVVARHALVTLLAVAIPLPLALELFKMLDEAMDISPASIEKFMQVIVLTVAGVTFAIGVLRVLLSPEDGHYRIIKASDQTARQCARAGSQIVIVYGTGIILAEFTGLVHAMVVVTIIDTILMVVAAALVMMRGLSLLQRAVPADDMPQGIYAASFGWATPLAWLVALACIGLVLTGYAALAGFVMGRFIVTALVIALAVVLFVVIEALFAECFSPTHPMAQAVSRTIGFRTEAIEIIGTVLSGTLRLAILVVTVFVVFGPWHLEYGEANPFEDAFFGLTLSDIRLGLGTAGFAILAFVVGMTATRVLVGWLDSQLLPRITPDQGVRNSATTIVGYGGFAIAAAFALSSLGVNPQNLAVVAGALSVGIGFGLQSIVSNFVSGLIVLAERPIRVGDVVMVKGEEGKVQKISVRSTVIRGGDRADVIVPNTDLITSIVRNRTFTDRTRLLRFSVLVEHDSDPVAVHKICLTSAFYHANVLKDPMPAVLIAKTTEIGVEFEIKIVIDDLDQGEKVRSDIYFQVLGHFREQGIKLAKG